MVELTRECEHCGRSYVVAVGPGRPRRYCRRSCRQRAFEQRLHAGEQAWSDERLVTMARELATLEDRLDGVAAIVEELQRDVDDGVVLDGEQLVLDLSAVMREAHDD